MIIENTDMDNNSSLNQSNNVKNSGSFFKNDVKTQIISAPKEGSWTRVIILPSFDMSKGTSDFQTSYVPYRQLNSDRTCPITGTPAFTHWAKSCRGYTFFGNTSKMFTSPLTGKAYRSSKGKLYPPAGIDPIVDIGNYIFFNKNEVPQEAVELIEKNENGFQRLPRRPRDFIISNALVQTSENPSWEFKVIAYSQTAYTDLVNNLAWKTGKNENGVTPEFDEFLFGDITDPVTGSILEVVKKKGINNGPEFTGFNISYDNKRLEGRKQIPAGLITPEVLAKRVVLNDTDFIDIWSYQKITDFLIEDGMIPFEVIKKAVKQGTRINPDLVNKNQTTHMETQPVSQQQIYTVQPSNSFTFPSVVVTDQPSTTTPITPQQPVQNIANTTASPIVDTSEIEEYKRVANDILSGSPSTESISKFMEYQTKYGDIKNYR